MVNSVNLKASVSFVGDGSTNRFYFGFDYINKQFVKVQVGADNSPLTYLTDYTVDDRSVTLTDTPAVGVAIRVYRETPSDRIVEWADGAFIKASQMTLESLQQLHLIEEAQDYPILSSLSRYPDGVNFNALGSRIINVSDPEDPQDVVTKHYMENVQGGFIAENTKILNEAKDTLSATQQTQSKAQTNETLSKAWATSTESPDNADDTQSSTGKTQSSRSWALYSEGKAQESATSEVHAKTSETNAKASETKARLSEQNAKVSETNAKTSETNAKTSEQKAKTSETNAKSSETKALTSEQNAKVSETNAKTSETSSHISETNSEVYYQSAKKWAEYTGSPDWEADTDSATGLTQSSRSWALYSKSKAQEANTSATNAKSSETKAKTSETNAKTSETKAATSEAHAKTSETNAKTSETNAKTSETNARASETNAETAEANAGSYSNSAYSSYIKSRDWAESTGSPDGVDDSFSTTGKTRSARGWAMQAKEYAGSLNLSFILDTLFPVGTVYMTENANFDPNNAWGVGVWVKTAIDRVLQGTNDKSKVGTTIDAGLPNITGRCSAHGAVALTSLTGAFYGEGTTAPSAATSGKSPAFIKYAFDASRYNPIYGSSDTVQPPAELVFIWKRIS